MDQRTVLVVEDDATISQALAARLRAEGYRVLVAHDGPTAVDLAIADHPDVVVLDVMLPGFDGYEVCRRVQAHRPVPVLMLTARAEESDTLIGLAVGADDYLTKPFSPRELVARLAALLRRVDRAREIAAADDTSGDIITAGSVTVDRGARRVRHDDVEVHLTPSEFEILLALLDNPRTVLSREQLVEHIRDWAEPSTSRLIDSHIKGLRRKLGHDIVRTVHGVGYALGIAPQP